MLLGLKFECYPAQRRYFKKEDSVSQTKVVAFAFTRRHFMTVCSIKCTWEDFILLFSRSSVPREKEIKGAEDLWQRLIKSWLMQKIKAENNILLQHKKTGVMKQNS